jgi:hypothetical protein
MARMFAFRPPERFLPTKSIHFKFNLKIKNCNQKLQNVLLYVASEQASDEKNSMKYKGDDEATKQRRTPFTCVQDKQSCDATYGFS